MSKLYSDAEQFIKDIYWEQSHDKRSTLNIVELVQKRLIADNQVKDPDYYNKKPGVIHVSSLSKCLRGVVLESLGAKPDPKEEYDEARQLGVFKAGNLFEDYILDVLGDRVIEKQREYSYPYKGITLVGRSDGLMLDDKINRIIECKSVHSDSFWFRQRNGELVAYHNQMQLQTYLWLERVLNGHTDWEGLFTYVSKDDVTVEGAPIKFNQSIIDEAVIPALDIIVEALAKKSATLVPLPEPVVFNPAKGQYQKNWLCTYCEYHNQCAGPNWLLEASAEVTRKNKELKAGTANMPHLQKKEKPTITALPL